MLRVQVWELLQPGRFAKPAQDMGKASKRIKRWQRRNLRFFELYRRACRYGGVDPFTLTNWRLDAQDRPGGVIVVRIIGEDAYGREIVTAPFVERLPARKVRTADGKVWTLRKRKQV